jgi:hypothetical protein
LRSGLFLSGVSAMICLPSRFRYCGRFKMLAVIERMVRFILLANYASFSNIAAASGYVASRNLCPFAPRSRLRPGESLSPGRDGFRTRKGKPSRGEVCQTLELIRRPQSTTFIQAQNDPSFRQDFRHVYRPSSALLQVVAALLERHPGTHV